jgi:import receptor subunit TOM20
MAPATSSRTLTVLAVAGVGALAYAVYFDHKRRTDAEFRKRLRTSDFVSFTTSHLHIRLGKEKKKLDKSAAQEAASAPASGNPLGDASVPTAEILAAMKSVQDDQVPTTPEEREKYFMAQVEQGEVLCAKGVFYAPCCAVVHLLTALYRAPLCYRGGTSIFQSPSGLSLARRVDYDLPEHCTRAYFQSLLHNTFLPQLVPYQSF